MANYEVLAGSHREAGRDYRKGDVVESELDLMTLFPNKFKETDKPGTPPPKEQARRFGVARTPAKPAAGPSTPQTHGHLANRLQEDSEKDEETEGEDLGEDITSKFPNPKGLLVFKSGRKYYIAEAAVPDRAINTEDLTTQDAVLKFLAK